MATSEIKVLTDDWHGNVDEEIVRCEFTDDEMRQIGEMTADKLYAYVHDHVVDKMNTKAGSDLYFVPRLNIGKLSLSLQTGYYIWSLRETDQLHDLDCAKAHTETITEIEWERAIIGTSSIIDVMINYDRKQLMCGQMNFDNLAEFFADLAKGKAVLNSY